MDIYKLEKVRNFSIFLSFFSFLLALFCIFWVETALGQLLFAPEYEWRDSVPPIITIIFVLLSLLFGLIAYILHTLIHSH